MQTVIGAFDDRNTADQAVQRLVDMGFDRSDVHVECHGIGTEQSQRDDREVNRERRGFFATLFGLDEDRHAGTWTEAVRRGSAVVVVDAADEAQATRAAGLLHELGAVDVDERSKQWQAEGWTGGIDDESAGAGRNVKDGKVLDVVQEELDVGKRRLDRGGVRVVERVTQQPVREIVQLREERAVVDRRPVDRPASPEDLARTGESAVEVREMTEEPVVAKRARVVEEVRVGKEVRERQQTVEDSVRRKDVDVQRLDGGETREERERATAAERDAKLRTPAEPDNRDLLGRRTDKPSS